jgi:hypothetical protein
MSRIRSAAPRKCCRVISALLSSAAASLRFGVHGGRLFEQYILQCLAVGVHQHFDSRLAARRH